MTCSICGTELFECMGCTDYSDYCLAMDGQIEFSAVRVTCQRCLMKRAKK